MRIVSETENEDRPQFANLQSISPILSPARNNPNNLQNLNNLNHFSPSQPFVTNSGSSNSSGTGSNNSVNIMNYNMNPTNLHNSHPHTQFNPTPMHPALSNFNPQQPQNFLNPHHMNPSSNPQTSQNLPQENFNPNLLNHNQNSLLQMQIPAEFPNPDNQPKLEFIGGALNDSGCKTDTSDGKMIPSPEWKFSAVDENPGSSQNPVTSQSNTNPTPMPVPPFMNPNNLPPHTLPNGMPAPPFGFPLGMPPGNFPPFLGRFPPGMIPPNLDTRTNSEGKAKRSSKKRKKKDPNEPSRPVSAYALFFRETQANIKIRKPDATFGEISKEVARQWDALDDDRKSAYKKKTENAKREYLRELAAYRASLVSINNHQIRTTTSPLTGHTLHPHPYLHKNKMNLNLPITHMPPAVLPNPAESVKEEPKIEESSPPNHQLKSSDSTDNLQENQINSNLTSSNSSLQPLKNIPPQFPIFPPGFYPPPGMMPMLPAGMMKNFPPGLPPHMMPGLPPLPNHFLPNSSQPSQIPNPLPHQQLQPDHNLAHSNIPPVTDNIYENYEDQSYMQPKNSSPLHDSHNQN